VRFPTTSINLGAVFDDSGGLHINLGAVFAGGFSAASTSTSVRFSTDIEFVETSHCRRSRAPLTGAIATHRLRRVCFWTFKS